MTECKPHCICKCDSGMCACWDGLGFAQLKRELDVVTKENQ